MNKNEVLKKFFGYDSFRKGQEILINSMLQGRDVLGIMPTGAGKSLCYQIPALMFSGITLVISPLISLMKDQVRALNEAGIHAAYINSSLTERLNDVFNAILVRGDATGDVVFYGKGAGKLPTASAVVSDIVSAVKHSDTSRSLTWVDSEQSFIRPFDRFTCANYIRLSADNVEVTKAVIKALFGNVEYLSSKKQPENELAFITGVMSEKDTLNACEKVSDGAKILGRIRVLDY